RIAADLDLQPEVAVELVGSACADVEENREGSISDIYGVDRLVPLLGSAAQGVVEGEANGVGAIGDRGAVGFGEASLKVHQRRNRRYLGKHADRYKRQQQGDESKHSAFHGEVLSHKADDGWHCDLDEARPSICTLPSSIQRQRVLQRV